MSYVFRNAVEENNEAQTRRMRFRWKRSPRIGTGGRVATAEYDDLPLDPWWLTSGLAQLVRRESLISSVGENRGSEVEDFFRAYLGVPEQKTTLLWSIRRTHIEALPERHEAIGVMQKVNNSRWINKYFRAVNERLNPGGTFAGCAEVNGQRRARIFRTYPLPLAVIYCWADFLVHRLWPKIPLFNRIYFGITRGHNRPLSEAEVLGRLVSCGFEIVEFRYLAGMMYFAVRKRAEPGAMGRPTYGPLCALQRVGRGGQMVTVYKLRTMHPYAEFLQEYLYSLNGTKDGDKIINDFRVAGWARILRKLWLDEAPMIINLFKGDLKIVGVRPLSRHKFGVYPPSLQELRTRYKPGLVPPFYADLPQSVEEFFQSEETYLRAYEKAPLRTDARYFGKAVWNILVRRARSG
jgi:lipopolysaccharide/colanic/teichoic acid biosynthesis glycosyltransferase